MAWKVCQKSCCIVSTSAMAVALSMALASPQALAQDTGSASSEVPETEGLADIIVTAQFRSQRVQDTPLSITALDSALMEARGQTNIAQIASQAPNVNLSASGAANGPTLVAFIRGVGQTDFNYAFEPGVGIYVDDVYLGTATGSLLQLLDLDRVEVLRGPQGTLQGKNSLGGSIKLFTKRPNGDNDGYLEAGYGSYGRIQARGSADFTIVPERVFLGLSGMGMHRRGWVDRIDYACANPGSGLPSQNIGDGCRLGREGGDSFAIGRASLRILPWDDVELNLSGDYLDDSSETPPTNLLYVNPANTVTPVNGVPYDGRFISGRKTDYSSFADPNNAYGPTVFIPKHSMRNWGVHGNLEWTLSDDFKLTSITAYRGYNTEFTEDMDGSPLPVDMQATTLRHRQFSQEIRLNGRFGDLLEGTIGGFYFKQKNRTQGRALSTYVPLDFLYANRIPSTSKSVFGDATLHVTPTLNLSAGLRYTVEDKKFAFLGYANPDGTPNPLFASLNGQSNKYHASRIDYRAVVDWRVTPNVMLYASTSTGYKGGGVNPRPFLPSQVQPFGEEKVTAYEAGLKSDLFDRRLRFNLSGFMNKYKGLQLTLTRCDAFSPFPGFPCALPANAGDADVYGVEAESSLKLGNFSVDGSLSYFHFEYKSLNPAVIAGGTNFDSVPPYAPKWKASVGIQYDAVIDGVGTLSPRVDYSYQSSIYGQYYNTDQGRIQPYSVVNAKVTWRSEEKDWQMSAEMTNVFDKTYHVYIFDLYNNPAGLVSARPGRPREFFLSVKRNF